MNRLHYLDALRSFCMMFGIFVHANTLGEYGALELTGDASSYFRMATFFLVSGMLSALVLQRRRTTDFLIGRAKNLGIPLIAGLLLLNPITLWLVFKHHNPTAELTMDTLYSAVFVQDGSYEGPLIWHLHLWFLFSLLIMALATPPCLYILKANATRKFIDATILRSPVSLRGLACATLVMGLVVALRVLSEVISPKLNDIYIIRATLIYIPYYFAGMAIFLNEEIFARARAFDIPLVIVAALAVVFNHTVVANMSGELPKLLDFAITSFVRTAAAFTLMAIFFRLFNRPSKFVSLAIDSIYTVYLFHFLLLYLVSQILPIPVSEKPFWIAASLITLAVGFFFHLFFVRKSKFLSLLFNGKANQIAS